MLLSKGRWTLYEESPFVNTGNVDFANCLQDRGFFWIADTTGHNYERKGELNKKDEIKQIWCEFGTNLPRNLTEEAIQKELKQIHQKFEDIGKTSTFTGAWIKSSGYFSKKTTLTLFQIGDSKAYQWSPDTKKLTLLSKSLESELGSTLKDMTVETFTVQPGDMIFLLTDGVFQNLVHKGKLSYHKPNTERRALRKICKRVFSEVSKNSESSSDSPSGSETSQKDSENSKDDGEELSKVKKSKGQQFLEMLREETRTNVKNYEVKESELDDCALMLVQV